MLHVLYRPTIIQQLVERKKSAAGRFNALWAPSDKARIVCPEEKTDETIVKKGKQEYIDWTSELT